MLTTETLVLDDGELQVLRKMSQDIKVCLICKEGASPGKNLLNDPNMLKDLLKCCQERVSLGQSDIQHLTDHLSGMNELELKSVYYHSECRKPIVNKGMIERLRGKRSRTESPYPSASRGPGRPSSATGLVRPKRSRSLPKEEVCMFSSCAFCPEGGSEPLHRVLSDAMGITLIEVKQLTTDDTVRICVADLEEPGDASALEKYYHRSCLRSAQRTSAKADLDNVPLIRSLCDEQIVLAIQNTLTDDDVTLNMAEVNDAYLSILDRYNVDVNETKNYRKYLKRLITGRLPGVQFVSSVRRNEPENLVLSEAVSKAVDLRLSVMDNGEIVSNLVNAASLLREEMLSKRGWSFTGSFDNFDNPSLLQFFLSHLLFGSHVSKVSGVREEEVDKTVDVACQFLVQNTRTDRQVKHEPKTDKTFRETVQTPLSIGLPLAIHSRVRDKNLVQTLSDVYIGSDYKKILELEKNVDQCVLQRMKNAGGFCLPDFIKKNENIWFAIDNIDLLEDTPTGQGTFHGTVIVINQQDVDGQPMNEPLVIPQKMPPQAPLKFEVQLQQEPIIKTTPLRFKDYKIGKRNYLLSTDFTHTWALANYLATDDDGEKTLAEPQTAQVDTQDNEESEALRDRGQSGSVLSVRGQMRKPEKLAKEDVMPTWAATKSLLISQSSDSHDHVRTNTEVIAPLFKTSPTDYGTLYTALQLTQGISAIVVGPQRRTLITLDLDLYARALKIQQSTGNTNWILRAGVLHIAFAALHALGKTIDGSGLDTCAIESGAYTSAALRGIFGGKAYKRGIEYHITTSLAIMMLQFDAILSTIQKGQVQIKCIALKDKLHERNPEMAKTFEEIQSWYAGNIKPCEDDKGIGEFAQFLLQYLGQVEILLHLISCCRSGDWEGYLVSLENIIKYFFARDLLNYARLMPVHLAQMNALEEDDPETWDALKSGAFVVAKSEIPFTRLFTDQALEQEIKTLKGHGGMVGLSRDEAALDRLVTTTPHLARLVNQYLNGFPKVSRSSVRKEHYQLSGEIALRSRANALKIRQQIELHCEGNPFKVNTPLKSLASSALVSNEAKQDILQFTEKGQKCFEEFVSQRLMSTSSVSLWDKMNKLKLKAFSNWMEKVKVRVGDKVIKLREERELLGRFLIIQASRPSLVPKLEETIGEYEMSTMPRSLCAVDGSLFIPTDKASFMHAVEDARTEPQDDALQPELLHEPDSSINVLIVDAMGVLQGMKKTPSMLKLSDLQDAFNKRIEKMMANYDEGRVVFDRYIDQSLKNKTRRKRAATSVEYEIHPEMKLTMSIKELLSASSTKKKLTCMLGQGLLEYFPRESSFLLVVVYDTVIKGHDFEEAHTHEEADTLIPHQVLASVSNGIMRKLCVWSPDTDVLLLLLDLVSCGRIAAPTCLRFATGMGTKAREIDVLERLKVIGRHKCQGLLGLHNFSGADWGGKFVGIPKKRWIDAYLKLEDDDQAISCFKELGERCIPAELESNELPAQVKGLEHFVCHVYSLKGPISLPSLRWELFRSKNLEGEMLPPTRATLLPHILRANYMTMRDKSYQTNCPELPPLEENGWTLEKGLYVPVRCLALPAPKAVIELIKCGCKTGCQGRCSCSKNGLPCTPLCKCYGGDCVNTILEKIRESDSDED